MPSSCWIREVKFFAARGEEKIPGEITRKEIPNLSFHFLQNFNRLQRSRSLGRRFKNQKRQSFVKDRKNLENGIKLANFCWEVSWLCFVRKTFILEEIDYVLPIDGGWEE